MYIIRSFYHGEWVLDTRYGPFESLEQAKLVVDSLRETTKSEIKHRVERIIGTEVVDY